MWRCIRKYEIVKKLHPVNFTAEWKRRRSGISVSNVRNGLNQRIGRLEVHPLDHALSHDFRSEQTKEDALNPNPQIRYPEVSSCRLKKYDKAKYPEQEEKVYDWLCERRVLG